MRAARFYVDADLGALGRALAFTRYDVTYAGDPGDPRRDRAPSPIAKASTPDPEWIPVVAAVGLVVISRDHRIARKPIEVEAVRSSGLRVVVLDTRRDRTTWGELAIVVAQWSAIERIASEPGPSIHIASRTTMRTVELTPPK